MPKFQKNAAQLKLEFEWLPKMSQNLPLPIPRPIVMPENHFIGEAARTYDRGAAGMFAPDILGPTVDRLAELAGKGPILEFAIGTGRVAIPLAARGFEVAGIELSADMLVQLQAKPEAASITGVEGDMATTRIDGGFSLVYLVFNTISNLTTQDEQVSCNCSLCALPVSAV